MIEQWLQTRTTVAEVEARYGWGSSQHDRWEQLKDGMMDGDELWEYCSPSETWRSLAGRQGIALVRNGDVVFAIVTMMS